MFTASRIVKLLCLNLLLAVSVASAAIKPELFVNSARDQIGVTVSYDPAYRKLAYPSGDVPVNTGVCCDVVIRALRKQNVDLQKEVHDDMAAHFSEYPRKWGLKKPDPNIDHRRVPNLMTYFNRKGYSVVVTKKADDFAPGDIVTWVLPGGLTHIGIVSDRKTAGGDPLIIHNIGAGTREEDILFAYPISGHFRLK
jgi:uncharacterized protein